MGHIDDVREKHRSRIEARPGAISFLIAVHPLSESTVRMMQRACMPEKNTLDRL
jgi:hypothetical protein